MATEKPKAPRGIANFKAALRKVLSVPKSEIVDSPKPKHRKKK